VLVLEDRKLLSTFSVTNTLDDGSAGTLCWAIVQANTTGGDQTIAFDKTVFKTPQTITLGGTQLELSDTTGTETITGPAGGVTVTGGGLSRVFLVDKGVSTALSNLTITGGMTGSRGGGLDVEGGTAALIDCTVTGNSSGNGSKFGGYGGAVSNFRGNVTLTECTVSGNVVEDGSGGGGLATLSNGTTTLTDCTINNNSCVGRAAAGGGLIEFSPGAVNTLTNCTISGNSGSNAGGGLAIYPGDTATLTGCTISGNTAREGGGVPAAARRSRVRSSTPTRSTPPVRPWAEGSTLRTAACR
jgi:fibronectin-binding autotransporter adhesin